MAMKIPDATPLTGAETAIVIQNGKAVKTTVQDIVNRVPTVKGAKGDTGSQGPAGAKGETGATGAAGTPKRIERFTGSTNNSGVATITFDPAFSAVPDIDVIEDWIANDQMVTGKVIPATASKAGCQVQVMVSRGTLLLSSGAFQKAPANQAITVRAIGN